MTLQFPVHVTLQEPTRSQVTVLRGPTVMLHAEASEQVWLQSAPHVLSQVAARAQASVQPSSHVFVHVGMSVHVWVQLSPLQPKLQSCSARSHVS
jgi:hypothetical protein